MTQPRPNADQMRRRFSASAVASALVVKFSGAGVCLGATPVEQRSRALGRLAPPITAVRKTIPDLILICRPDCTGMSVPVHRRSASMCQCQEPGRRCSSRASDRSSKPAKSVATVAKSQ
jgi:hypothetical protein